MTPEPDRCASCGAPEAARRRCFPFGPVLDEWVCLRCNAMLDAARLGVSLPDLATLKEAHERMEAAFAANADYRYAWARPRAAEVIDRQPLRLIWPYRRREAP